MEGDSEVAGNVFWEENVVIANLGALYVVGVLCVASAIWVKHAKTILYVAINEHMFTKPRPKI